jgi:hypothetical protein
MSPHRQDSTTIVLSGIHKGVHATPNLLECMETLCYSDHDIVDVEKFREFARQVYLDDVGIGPFEDPILQPKKWVDGLANTRILNVLDIPHFGRGRDAKICIKQLMEVTHEVYLWLEEPVSIDLELIAFITGLPSWGENPT